MSCRAACLLMVLGMLFGGAAADSGAAEPIAVGKRRELFVDRHLVDKLTGSAQLKIEQPQPREVVLVTDKPWEGNTSAYYTIFQDGDLYRMYYRGAHYDTRSKKAAHREVTCYAESKDGIHWKKPELGLFAFNGSKKNNIVWDGFATHCFTPFKDANPDCPPEARYKAVSAGKRGGKRGLFAFQSPDGIRWSLMRETPVITEGAFDSQNLAFWDPHRKLYVDYHRNFRNGKRDIMTATSTDFLKWTRPVYIKITGAPRQHLYTNAIRNYVRAPHILLGFPTRYLPNEGSRVEPTLMASRDGLNFHRWADAVISEDAPKDRGGNRSNYMTWGMLQLPGKPNELSVYATEAYYEGPDSRVRRFTYRVDGFVALVAGKKDGALLTKPFTFYGRKLQVNCKTGAAGRVAIELLTAEGQPIPGFRASDAVPIRGDHTAHTVAWRSSSDVSRLLGKPVRMRIQLRDASFFAFQFVE